MKNTVVIIAEIGFKIIMTIDVYRSNDEAKICININHERIILAILVSPLKNAGNLVMPALYYIFSLLSTVKTDIINFLLNF